MFSFEHDILRHSQESAEQPIKETAEYSKYTDQFFYYVQICFMH